MRIELKQSQMDTLDKHLGTLATRYEAEAAAFASLGGPGRKFAEQRLQDAEEVKALWDFFLNV